jgi:hypothetical protein
MGLPVVADGKGSWTIDGVPQSVLDKYSRRAFELLAEAEKRGITDPAEKAQLASKFRLDKDAGEKLTTEELHAYWKSRLTDDEAAALEAVVQATQRGGEPQTPTRTAAQAIDHALAHFFGPDGRNSAESEKAVLEEALANLLRKTELQKAVRGQVIMIDEAGQAGTRAMRQVFDLVKQQRAEGYDSRILLVGDPQQHRGVPRGQVLHILQDQAGLVPARLNTINGHDHRADARGGQSRGGGGTGRAARSRDDRDQGSPPCPLRKQGSDRSAAPGRGDVSGRRHRPMERICPGL